MPTLESALAGEVAALRARGLGRRTDRPAVGIDFTSNDVLGLARDPRLVAAAEKALREHGAGGRAARLLGGGGGLPAEAERAAVDWLGAPSALLLSSGYQANLSLLGALVQAGDVVVTDRLVHASLIDAARLSGAEVRVAEHSDPEHTAWHLEAARGARRRMVVTEGVFSMDGDVPPLAELGDVALRHRARLVVDEAHAAGVVGTRGRGAWDAAVESGADPAAVVARVVTGGKALGAGGALVVGAPELREAVVHRGRAFVYTTAPAPAVSAALRAGIEAAAEADDRRALVSDRAAAVARAAGAASDPEAAIVPVHVGAAEDALGAQRSLEERGLDVRAVRPPTVPDGTARLRVVVRADHSEREVEQLAGALEELRPSTGDHDAEPLRVRSAKKPWFVVGTDTEVGKTIASAGLVRALARDPRRGAGVRYWKPVQTGDDDDTTTVRGLVADLGEHVALGEPAYRYPLPASPHEAARAVDDEIDPERVDVRFDEERRTAGDGELVVELAGGLMVPLVDGYLQADWLARARPRVCLVARSGLGTLNHTLLTAEALRARRIRPELLILVGPHHPSNAATLASHRLADRVLELPVLEALEPEALARAVEGWEVPL